MLDISLKLDRCCLYDQIQRSAVRYWNTLWKGGEVARRALSDPDTAILAKQRPDAPLQSYA